MVAKSHSNVLYASEQWLSFGMRHHFVPKKLGHCLKGYVEWCFGTNKTILKCQYFFGRVESVQKTPDFFGSATRI